MAETTHLTEDHDGHSVTLPAGSRLQVSLPENGSTGYRWSLADPPAGVLALEGDHTAPPSAPGAGIGAAGGRTFRLQAKGPGEAKLHFRLARPWDPTDVLREFRAHVTVH